MSDDSNGRASEAGAGLEISRWRLADAVLEAMEEDVLACDETGQIRYVNRAARQSHGLTAPEEFRPHMRAACDAGRVRALDGTALDLEDLPLQRALRTRDVVHQQFMLEEPGREMIKQDTAVPLQEHGRVIGAVVVGRNVRGLMQLDRLTDQFLSTAAHELKTPLAIIKGGARTVESQQAANETLRRGVGQMCRGADRIDHVVTELLDSSQLQLGRLALHREVLDLGELVERAVARASRVSSRPLFAVRLGSPVRVLADRVRISQVLANLLSNAVRFSPEGARIEVDMTRSAGEAIVSVRDRGIGIPRDRQAKIFERFYRAHADTPHDLGGIGLGLYLAKEFVESHGGRIWFESVEGEGTTFSFSLPC